MEKFLSEYQSKKTDDTELEIGVKFVYNKLTHIGLFNRLKSETANSGYEIIENLDIYHEDGTRRTMHFKQGVNQKIDTFIKKELVARQDIKRSIDSVDNIKAKMSYEKLTTASKSSVKFMRFKLRVRFNFRDNATAELDLIKTVKPNADIKNIKETVFKPYSELFTNSIEYSMFDELRLEFEFSKCETLDQLFEPINWLSGKLSDNDSYQRAIFELARSIVFNRKGYLEAFRHKLGLKKLLNNVIEVNANVYYKQIQPKLPSEGFYITDKIDGKRTILCVDRRGSYTINDSFTKLPITARTENKIYIDCEQIGDKLYAFDVILFQEVNAKQPFGQRLTVLQKAVNYAQSIGINIEAKEYVLLNENWKEQLETFYKKRRQYEIDGLIFTPNDSSDYSSMLGFKWKPAEHSTIDFWIKKSNTGYVLCSGASQKDVQAFGLSVYQQEGSIVPVLFTPSNMPTSYMSTNLPLSDNSFDNKIGEFGWQDNMWTLKRIRKDRDVELARGDYYGNYFTVAESIWYSINNPLHFEMLFDSDGSYFVEDDNKDFKAQRNFNSFVKTEVLDKYLPVVDNARGLVVDLAAGKGQDLIRIAGLGVKQGIFVDSDKNALQELIRRKHALSQSKGKVPTSKMKVTTAAIDLSVPHTQIYEQLKNAYGSPFSADSVICNFALHYFTGSVESISNIMRLAHSLLKDNGVFIVTAFNGRRVFDACGSHGWTAGQYVITPSWQVSQTQHFENVGQSIKVKLPFSREMYSEYLVNFEYIKDLFSNNGLQTIAHGSFADYVTKTHINLSEDDIKFVSMYDYCVFAKSETSLSVIGSGITTGIEDNVTDDRPTLANLPQANKIILVSRVKLSPIEITAIETTLTEHGFRSSANRRLKKKIFTWSNLPTVDPYIEITDKQFAIKIDDYIQWITKLPIANIEIGGICNVRVPNSQDFLRIE
jgi:hypothetical protein